MSPHLEPAILRAMAIDPRARFQSAEEFDEALDEERSHPREAAGAQRRAAKSGGLPARLVAALGDDDGALAPGRKGAARDSRAMTLAIAAGMVVVLGGGTWLVVRRVWRIPARSGARRAEARAARARVLATQPPPVVQVTVEVEPKSAQLTVDGAQVGGPVVAVLKDGKRHLLRAEADGYRPRSGRFSPRGIRSWSCTSGAGGAGARTMGRRGRSRSARLPPAIKSNSPIRRR